MRYATWARPSVVLMALALLVASPAPRAAGAPEGQMTWAVHVSIAPAWFDPGEHPGIITSMLVFYALHDALIKPMPGKPTAPSLAESWTASPDGLAYEFVLAPRRGLPQRRDDDRGGRQVLLRALPRRRGQALQGEGCGRRGRRPAAGPRPAARALAGLHGVLCHAGHGRCVDRAQGLRAVGGRGRVQEGPDRRRPLQVRLLQPRRGDGARGARALLAQAAQRQAARLPRGAGRDDASGHAQARGGRRCLFDPWCAGGGDPAHAGAQACAHPDTRDVLGRLHQRAMEPEIAVARSARAPGRQSGDRPAGHQSGRDAGLLQGRVEHHPLDLRVLLAGAAHRLRSGAGQAAAGGSRLSARLRRRRAHLQLLLQQRGRGRGQLLQAWASRRASSPSSGSRGSASGGRRRSAASCRPGPEPSATPPPASTTT